MIEVTAGNRRLNLGHLGENEHTRVVFDIGDWQKMYPGATYSLVNLRHGDEYAYPVANIGVDGTKLYWTITNTELSEAGNGRCELIITKDSVIAKSIIYETCVYPALDENGDTPEAWVSWQTAFEAMRDEAAGYADEAEAASLAIQNMGVAASSLRPDEPATVTKTIDAETGAVTLEFGIPQGVQGETGNGIASVTKSGSDTLTDTYTITFTDGTTTTFAVSNGNGIVSAIMNADFTLTITFADGSFYTTPSIQGATPNIRVGTVTTGAAGSQASAIIHGTPEDPVLDMTIPMGNTGATPDFKIGTVETLPMGEDATASITGTAEEPVLNLGLPTGVEDCATENTASDILTVTEEIRELIASMMKANSTVLYVDSLPDHGVNGCIYITPDGMYRCHMDRYTLLFGNKSSINGFVFDLTENNAIKVVYTNPDDAADTSEAVLPTGSTQQDILSAMQAATASLLAIAKGSE